MSLTCTISFARNIKWCATPVTVVEGQILFTFSVAVDFPALKITTSIARLLNAVTVAFTFKVVWLFNQNAFLLTN